MRECHFVVITVPGEGGLLQRLSVTNAYFELIRTFSDGQFPVWTNPVRLIRLDAQGVPQQPGVVFALPNEEHVAIHVLFEHKQWLRLSTYLNAPPLAYSEKMGAVVLPYANSVFRIPKGGL